MNENEPEDYSDDDGLDPEDLALVNWCAQTIRRDIVNSLLMGNDTGCFTTQQYTDAYQRGTWASSYITVTPEMAAIHLRSLPDLIREVSPGVWASR